MTGVGRPPERSSRRIHLGLGIVCSVRYCLPCIERGSETADGPRT
jgi:hypothetical protein